MADEPKIEQLPDGSLQLTAGPGCVPVAIASVVHPNGSLVITWRFGEGAQKAEFFKRSTGGGIGTFGGDPGDPPCT
jgi:hypothetical protein